jgi:hypothetical protein
MLVGKCFIVHIQHLRLGPRRMRGLQLVDDWRSRPGDSFAGLPKCPRGVRQKQMSCAGLRGRVPGRGGAPDLRRALSGAHMVVDAKRLEPRG